MSPDPDKLDAETGKFSETAHTLDATAGPLDARTAGPLDASEAHTLDAAVYTVGATTYTALSATAHTHDNAAYAASRSGQRPRRKHDPALLLGTRLDGRFLLEAVIGGGSQGTVYRAKDTSIDDDENNTVAVKLLVPEAAHGFGLTRFIREYRVASRLSEQYCVRAHTMGHCDDGYYFSMDYLAGGTLPVPKKKGIRATLPDLTVVVRLGLQLLEALDYVHSRGISHRDIKPQNILLVRPFEATGDGATLQARLTDFGIAKVSDLSEDTTVGSVAGTMRYLAPEVLITGVSDERADLYAVGVVLYELVTGRHPHDRDDGMPFVGTHGEDPVPVLVHSPELPAGIAGALMALLRQEPAERPRTAAAAHDRLYAAAVEAKLAGPLPPPPALCGRPYLFTPGFVGRQTEIAHAKELLPAVLGHDANAAALAQSAEQRAATILVVSGPAGVGKSRFADQLLRLTAPYSVRILVGQCKRNPERSYEGIAGVLAALDEVAVQHPRQEARERSDSSIAEMERLPSVSDPVYRQLKETGDDAATAARKHELRRRYTCEKAAASFLRIARKRPVVLLVEDVQWSDEDTIALLGYVLRHVAISRKKGHPARLATILTHRPKGPGLDSLEKELQAQATVEAPPERFVLPPLTKAAAVDLVASALGQPRGKDLNQFCDALLSDRPTTPLYVEQALRLLLQRGTLVSGMLDEKGRWNGRWNLDPAATQAAQLPATVQEAIGEQAARLSVGTQEMLAQASLMGRAFTAELLEKARGVHRNEILDSCDEAAAAGFIVPIHLPRDDHMLAASGGGVATAYRFAHDRYHEALEQSLSADDLADFHARAAKAVQSCAGENDATVEILARHYAGSGAHADTFRTALRAADLARESGSFEHASKLYAKAVAAAQSAALEVTPQIRTHYADACKAAGDYEHAAQLYAGCIAELPAGSARRNVRLSKADVRRQQRRYADACAELEAMLHDIGERVYKRRVVTVLRTIWCLSWLLLCGLWPRLVKRRPAADQNETAILLRTWRMLAETSQFYNYGRAVYAGAEMGIRALTGGFSMGTTAALAMWSYIFGGIGKARLSRSYAQLALQALAFERAPSETAFMHVVLIAAQNYRGELGMAGENAQKGFLATELSGDAAAKWMFTAFLSSNLRYSGRLSAAALVTQYLEEFALSIGAEQLRNVANGIRAADCVAAGDFATALAIRRTLCESYLADGDVMLSLVSRALVVWLQAFTSERNPEANINEALDTLEQWLKERYSMAADSPIALCLAAAALSYHRLEKRSRVLTKRLSRARRSARRKAMGHSLETPLYLASCAAIDWTLGRRRRAERLLTQGIARAIRDENILQWMAIHRLWEKLAAPGSEAHKWHGQQAQRLLDSMQAATSPPFKAIVQGEFGPAPDAAAAQHALKELTGVLARQQQSGPAG